MTRPFRIYTRSGRVYEAVQFSSDQICINHPNDPDFAGLSFSLYDDIASPPRTCKMFRQMRVEFDDQDQP